MTVGVFVVCMTLFGSLTPAAQWFVDSVAGSDSNNGTAVATPLQTIAALLGKSIQSGDLIALKNGSTWRETLVIPADRVHVTTYGPSATAPLLDCSEVISAGDWSKTLGLTNVYQASLTCEATGSTWLSAWENDTRLVRATSQANCDATPGSYVPSSDSATSFTLYVHAGNSSNPGSNGRTYEYSKRYAGYDASTSNRTGCHVFGIRTRRNLANDGSLLIGPSGWARQCTALEGSKHSVYARAGALLEDVTASGAYFGSADFTMFVGNENSPNGEPLTFRRCAAIMPAFASNGSGFYAHRNTSGSFGELTFDGCTSANCAIGISGNNAATGRVVNCSVTDAMIAYSCDHDWDVTDCYGQANHGGTPQILLAASTNVRVRNLTGAVNGLYWIWIAANSSLDIADCDWDGMGGGTIGLMLRGTGASLKARNMVFPNAPGEMLPYSVVTGALGDYSLDLDQNTFRSSGGTGRLGTTDYSFAQWQGLGHDLTSQVVPA